jgi:hypothetical protein
MYLEEQKRRKTRAKTTPARSSKPGKKHQVVSEWDRRK